MSNDNWPVRNTARIVLLDPAGRVLLMKGRLPNGGDSAWFTVGGGIEPGETLEDGARREAREETGLTDVALGPRIWTCEVSLERGDERLLILETFFIAHTAGGALTREGWEAHEHDLVDDLRWWTLEELEASDEAVFPPGFAALLHALRRDGPPPAPVPLPSRHVVFDA